MDILFKKEFYRSGNNIIYVEQYKTKESERKYWRYGFYQKTNDYVKINVANCLLNKPKRKTLCNIFGKDIVRTD